MRRRSEGLVDEEKPEHEEWGGVVRSGVGILVDEKM